MTADAHYPKNHCFSILDQDMGITITIDDDAFATANAYAKARSLNLGQAVSELIRRGGDEELSLKHKQGVWVFDLPADTPRVTAHRVRQLLDSSA